MSVAQKPSNPNSTIFNINNFTQTTESGTSSSASVVLNQTVLQDELIQGDNTIEGNLIVLGNCNFNTEPLLISSPNINTLQNNNLVSKLYVDTVINSDPYPQLYTGGNSSGSTFQNIVSNSGLGSIQLRDFTFSLYWRQQGIINITDIEFETSVVYSKNLLIDYDDNITRKGVYRFIYTASYTTGQLNSVQYIKLSGDDMIAPENLVYQYGSGRLACGILNNKGYFLVSFGNTSRNNNWISSYGFSAKIVGNFPNIINNTDGTILNAYFQNFNAYTI